MVAGAQRRGSLCIGAEVDLQGNRSLEAGVVPRGTRWLEAVTAGYRTAKAHRRIRWVAEQSQLVEAVELKAVVGPGGTASRVVVAAVAA